MLIFLRKLKFKILVTWWKLWIPVVVPREVTIATGVRFDGCPIITMHPRSSITLEANVVLCSNTEFTALGVSRPVILRTLRPGATINIGGGSGLSGVTICAATDVNIGRECLIGADVMIVDNDFHPIAPIGRRQEKNPERIAAAPIIIEENVFIGARAIVLKGVTIGANSVVGAGAVVVSDIPKNCVAAGNPARVIKRLSVG